MTKPLETKVMTCRIRQMFTQVQRYERLMCTDPSHIWTTVGGTLNKGLLSPSAGAQALRGHESCMCLTESTGQSCFSTLHLSQRADEEEALHVKKMQISVWGPERRACLNMPTKQTAEQPQRQRAVSAQPNQRLSQASAESEDASSRVTAFSATAALIVPDVPQEARAGNVIPTRRLISEHIDTNADSSLTLTSRLWPKEILP